MRGSKLVVGLEGGGRKEEGWRMEGGWREDGEEVGKYGVGDYYVEAAEGGYCFVDGADAVCFEAHVLAQVLAGRVL